MSDEKDKSTGITKSDLKEILAAVGAQNAEQLKEIIAELKKPTVLEQQEIDKQAALQLSLNAERKDNAGAVLAQMQQKRDNQLYCSHKHPAAHGGHSHGVHITEPRDPNGYILCQKCQAVVRPGVKPQGYTGGDIYDTRLFNTMIQELPSNRLFE
jgi:hypothetical protein